MSNDPISITINFRRSTFSLSLLPESTLAELFNRVQELTRVPPNLQKLLYKGKKVTGASGDQTRTLSEAGFKDGLKVQMLGPSELELYDMAAVENENRRRETILRERALKRAVKLRPTGSGAISSLSSSSSAALQYRFHDVQPHPNLPAPDQAIYVLKRLAEDPAIKSIMQEHQFTVGLLTELAPHEHPELLGLNENKGQAIKLRLRTDRYDGFRLYREVRRVLCHELTHNVWGDHDENFKTLNSQLNREVAAFEKAALDGAHTLGSAPPQYDASQPTSNALEAEARTYILGGSSESGSLALDSSEARRHRVLTATLHRLLQEEEDIVYQCGTHPDHT